MFVMTHEEIQHVLRAGKQFTYANPVVDHHPHKEDAYQICITAEGNLIDYEEKLSVPTVDLVTVKLQWNSVVSTVLAKYICIDIIFFTRIYDNPPCSISILDYRTIQLEAACIEWENSSRIKTCCGGLTSGRNIGQQAT